MIGHGPGRCCRWNLRAPGSASERRSQPPMKCTFSLIKFQMARVLNRSPYNEKEEKWRPGRPAAFCRGSGRYPGSPAWLAQRGPDRRAPVAPAIRRLKSRIAERAQDDHATAGISHQKNHKVPTTNIKSRRTAWGGLREETQYLSRRIDGARRAVHHRDVGRFVRRPPIAPPTSASPVAVATQLHTRLRPSAFARYRASSTVFSSRWGVSLRTP